MFTLTRKRFLQIIIQLTFVSIYCLLKTVYFYQKNAMDLTQEDWVSQFEADQNAVMLDVRTEDECDQGIIESSINIDIYKGPEFVAAIEALDKSKNYYVYCRSGVRSAKACAIMNELGIENAYNLLGGIIEWTGDIV